MLRVVFVMSLFVVVVSCQRPCTASNCLGCCTMDGVCAQGVTIDTCGTNGNMCASCALGQTCNGVCQGEPTSTGGGTATGGGSAMGGGTATGGGAPDTRLRVFVTSAEYSGSFGGLAQADTLCTNAARGAYLGGTWKAWLSTSTIDAVSRVGDVGPWFQVDDSGQYTKTFNNKANLTTSPLVALYVDEQRRGSLVSPRSFWTGTQQNGQHSSATCDNWTSTANQGLTGFGSNSWSERSAVGCYNTYSLVCFEQSRDPAPPVPPTTNKGVFVTSAEYTGAIGGLTQADGLCTNAALAANKSGMWKAWLSTSTTDALTRIADVGPWYQATAEGKLVKTFNNRASLTAAPLEPLYVDEQGRGSRVSPRSYWTGTSQTGQHMTVTCDDWTSASNYGRTGFGSNSWSERSAVGCYNTYSLLCFEQ